MKTAGNRQVRLNRRTDVGAVLVVVLIVMIGLLGLGMSGLFLTGGSVQMNTNINLRNQALVVAEAGIERARSVLNDQNVLPTVPALLAGSGNAADEIPNSTSSCSGQSRGAVMIDRISTGCATNPTPAECILVGVDYPSLTSQNQDRVNDLPAGAGAVARTTMGKYTVYIRQDMADCRMGNFTCDKAPLPAGVPAGAPVCLPEGNGAVVVRAEGVASDGRTKVALEVTMTPSLGATKVNPVPMGAMGSPNDPPGFNPGIVVNSTAPQNPPQGSGGVGSGGTGSGGAGSGGAAGSSTTPGSGVGGAGGQGTGGSGTGGSGSGGRGSGGTTGCDTSRCPNVGIMGEYGVWSSNTSNNSQYNNGAEKFRGWLKTHSNGCSPQTISLDKTITAETLKHYNVIIMLDLYHNTGDRNQCVNNLTNCRNDQYGAYRTGHQRHLSDAEFNAFRTWVEGKTPGTIRGGHGFAATVGYFYDSPETYNINGILKRFNLKYETDGSGNVRTAFSGNPSGSGVDITVGSSLRYHPGSGAYPPQLVGVSKLHITGGTPIQVISSSPSYAASPYLYAEGVDGSWFNIGYYVSDIGNPPEPSKPGRINVWTDEWITYDDVWSGAWWQYQTEKYWENVVQWIGECN